MSIANLVGAVALSVSPAHVALAPGAHATVAISTGTARNLTIAAKVGGLSLDARGRPRLVRPGDAAPWLQLSASTLRAAHGRTQLTISVRRVAGAAPGDHTAVVLLTATEPGSSSVLVRMRLGLIVSVRVPGRVLHRLMLGPRLNIARSRRTIELVLANRGNVTESIDGSRLSVILTRRGKAVAVLRPQRREFLPRSKGIAVFNYARRLRGPFVARVVLRQSTALVVRRYRLQL